VLVPIALEDETLQLRIVAVVDAVFENVSVLLSWSHANRVESIKRMRSEVTQARAGLAEKETCGVCE
jgi:hypothetical protein